MKYNRIITIFALVLLVGCGGKREVVKQDFTTFELKGDTLPMEIIASYPRIKILDSLLLISSSREEPVLRVYRKDGTEPIATYGTIGRSRKEFLQPVVTTTLDDTIIVQDFSGLSVSAIKYDGDLNELREIDRKSYTRRKPDSLDAVSYGDLYIMRLSSGGYVASANFSYDRLFSYYDSDMQFHSYFGMLEDIKGAETMSITNYVQYQMATHNDVVVAASLSLPYICVYSVIDGEPKKMWDDRIYPMHLKVGSGGDIKFDRDKAKGFFGGVTMSDKFIYVVFRDIYLRDKGHEDESTTILVYDYKGNRCARLNIPEQLFYMAVENDDSSLYAMESIYNKIMRYDIKDIVSEF